jgi:hypothetical protein
LVGWAWRPTRPDEPVAVVVQAEGVEVGRGRADRLDPGILARHGRPGVPGFCIRLHRLPGGLYPLALTLHAGEANGADTGTAGARIGGPFMVSEIAELMPVTDPVPPAYEGAMDDLSAGVLCGWARDAARPDWPVIVELLDNERPIGRGRADELRQDLVAAGKGSGRHGFRLVLSNTLLDGQSHRLQVRIAGSKFNLPNGPLVFGPQNGADPAVAISALRQEVDRLRDQVTAIVDPSTGVMRELVRRLSERVAALAEVHRESIERELEVLRRFAFRPEQAARPVEDE